MTHDPFQGPTGTYTWAWSIRQAGLSRWDLKRAIQGAIWSGYDLDTSVYVEREEP